MKIAQTNRCSMAQTVSIGFIDRSLDKGFTGFTLDSGSTNVAAVQTYAEALEAWSDCEACRAEVSDVIRIPYLTSGMGDMNVERRGVIEVTWDNGTTSRRYTLSVPGISQAHVVGNSVSAATLTDACVNGVIAAFATLSGHPVSQLFFNSSRVYESRK